MELELISPEGPQSPQSPKRSRGARAGQALAWATGGVAVTLTAICVPFVSPALRRVCLPYVPATDRQVAHVLRALAGCRGACLDVGSGDGRVVIAAARRGFTSHGVEMNPWLVAYSRLSCYCYKVHADTRFFRRDLWKFPLEPYRNIVIFGVDQMMEEFESKLLKEASDGTTVVACRFPLPNLSPLETIGHGVDTVWKYKINKTK